MHSQLELVDDSGYVGQPLTHRKVVLGHYLPGDAGITGLEYLGDVFEREVEVAEASHHRGVAELGDPV